MLCPGCDDKRGLPTVIAGTARNTERARTTSVGTVSAPLEASSPKKRSFLSDLMEGFGD
jgi:hypothetical protein